MEIWDILGIEPTLEKKEIKKAYFRQLKFNNPEDNPEGFKRLRAAYEQVAGSEQIFPDLSPDVQIRANPSMDVAHSQRASTSKEQAAIARAEAIFEQISIYLEHVQLSELDAFLESETQDPDFWNEVEIVNHLNLMLVSYAAAHPIPNEALHSLHDHLEWVTRIDLLKSKIDPQVYERFSRKLNRRGNDPLLKLIDHFLEKFRKAHKLQTFRMCMRVLRADIDAFLEANPRAEPLLYARIYIWLGEADLDAESVVGLVDRLNIGELDSALITERQYQKATERFFAAHAQYTKELEERAGEQENEQQSTRATGFLAYLGAIFILVVVVSFLRSFGEQAERSHVTFESLNLGLKNNDPNMSARLWDITCADQSELAMLLLSAGATPEYLDQKSGRTVLYQAITQNSTAMVLALLEGKANPNQLTRDGSSPLQAAVDQKNREIVKMLIEHGVNLAQGDPIADQARATARSAGEGEMAALLDPKNQVIPPPL